MRILFVEDQPMFQKILIQMLAETPVDFEIESNGDEAFRRCFEEGPFDLVLTDQQHPGLSGVQLVEEVKKKNPSQNILLMKKPFRRRDLLDLLTEYAPKSKQ